MVNHFTPHIVISRVRINSARKYERARRFLNGRFGPGPPYYYYCGAVTSYVSVEVI